MRYTELMEGSRQPSPELIQWLQRWVESSHQIADQISKFTPLIEEASLFLNVTYPALYRGMSITEEQLDAINAGETITIPAHNLQSWTKSRSIADDYALPGYGGDVGVLVRKTGGSISPVLDIQNVVRAIGTRHVGKFFTSYVRTDIVREKEVVVLTHGSTTLSRKDIVKVV